MKRQRSCSPFIYLLLLAASASAQPTSIHDQIQQVYSFQPRLLNDQQLAEKSARLDEFWNKAKAQQSIYISTLRQELGNFENPPFFLYDGSMLLLSLSDAAADRKVALAAIARCDLRDLQAKEYFLQVHRMATLDEDTTAAAFHVLEEPTFKVFIPAHVLTLGQDYVLIYLLLPTRQEYWLQPAIERLKTEKDQTAQKSLLLLLWYAQTDASDRAIASLGDDASKPAAPREYAKGLIKRKDSVGARQRAEALLSTEASLRQRRRDRLKAVSDEALLDLDNYTMLLVAKRK